MTRARTILLVALLVVVAIVVTRCDVMPRSAAVAGPSGFAGALTISGDSMHALAINPAKWSAPVEAERQCSGEIGCFFTKKVKVDLYAEIDVRNYGPSTPSTPILIGKLKNKGNASTRMYDMEPGPYNYLVWLVPGGTADTGRYVITQVLIPPPHTVTAVDSGIQIGCMHPKSWGRSFPLFRDCGAGTPDDPDSVRTSSGARSDGMKRAGFFSFATVLARMFGREDPAWFTCTSGCCTSGEPE